MPKTPEEWNRVEQRIEDNFGLFLNEIPLDGAILDIPCGVGYLEHFLLKKGYSNIRAVDLSKEQIQVARDKLREHNVEWAGMVQFTHADAFKYLKQHQANFHAIAEIDFLEHLPKDKVMEVLRLSHRALRKDGLLFVRVINAENPMWGKHFYHDFTHETPFTQDTLRQCLDMSNFETLKIDFEVLPASAGRLRQTLRWSALWILGRLLGIKPAAFTEDLIAIARKR
jgi:cyclopropane fatty-acyl-phospholipid synthase-like methyltransferase